MSMAPQNTIPILSLALGATQAPITILIPRGVTCLDIYNYSQYRLMLGWGGMPATVNIPPYASVQHQQPPGLQMVVGRRTSPIPTVTISLVIPAGVSYSTTEANELQVWGNFACYQPTSGVLSLSH